MSVVKSLIPRCEQMKLEIEVKPSKDDLYATAPRSPKDTRPTYGQNKRGDADSVR